MVDTTGLNPVFPIGECRFESYLEYLKIVKELKKVRKIFGSLNYFTYLCTQLRTKGMETVRIAQAVSIPQEELEKWLKSPLTKALMRNVNEYNKKCESKFDMPSIFIAAQWDTSTEYNSAIIHFGVVPH